jgi:rubrerythrin
MTLDCLNRYEIFFSELRANPTEEDMRGMRDYLKKNSNKYFTEKEVKQAIDQALGLTWVSISLGITEDRAKRKQEAVAKWKEEAKKKDQRVLSTKPFENIKCSVCTIIMFYKWSTLYEEPKDTTSRVLFFYECPKCSKRDAIFEDGQLWVSQGTNNCPICKSKRETTLTQDKAGKNFIIYECKQCGSKQVENGVSLTKE